MKHPGEILKDRLSASGMTQSELSVRTGFTEKHICTVINGDKSISTAFAKSLGYVFENTSFWIKAQAEYDQEQLRLKDENNIKDEEIRILKPLNEITKYFIELGYISHMGGASSKVMQLRELLQISDLTKIPKVTYNAAYRAQLSTNIKVDPYVLFAWQRLCEKQTENMHTNQTLNTDLLKSSIDGIREMTLDSINDVIQHLKDVFSKCGIAFQVVKNFRGAPVQGFIKKTTGNQLILCLTIRGKRADRFWFTLFHEIAHILHGDYKTRFVDFDSTHSEIELYADQFASETLIPPAQYHDFIMSTDCTSWNSIKAFAKRIHVAPFIVLGRLQNDGFVDWTEHTDQVVRYEWA